MAINSIDLGKGCKIANSSEASTATYLQGGKSERKKRSGPIAALGAEHIAPKTETYHVCAKLNREAVSVKKSQVPM